MRKRGFTNRTEFGTMKKALFHRKALDVIRGFPENVQRELGYLVYLLQRGVILGMPDSRPMPAVALGVSELRVAGSDGQYRAFYYTKNTSGILVFHTFEKKRQVTPRFEIEVGRKRLQEMLEN